MTHPKGNPFREGITKVERQLGIDKNTRGPVGLMGLSATSGIGTIIRGTRVLRAQQRQLSKRKRKKKDK